MDLSNLESKIADLLSEPEQILNPSYHSFLLANQTSNAVAEYLKQDQRIILPIGSTEQHGPDAVLGVDHITATGIAYGLSKVTGILCAPPINCGMAIHHLGFAGTIAYRPTTYINIIIDTIYSLKRHGFKEVIVINGHGGNKSPFFNAIQEKLDEFSDIEFRFFNWWVMPELEEKIIKKYFGDKEGYHATPTEVSLTMALLPGMMQMPDSYTCPQKQVISSNCNWVMPSQFKALYPDGVMKADYSLATAEICLEVLSTSIKEIVKVLFKNN